MHKSTKKRLHLVVFVIILADFFPLQTTFTADVEIRIPSIENLELRKVLFQYHEVDQNIALHASPSAGNSTDLISVFAVHSTFVLNPNNLTA